MRSGVVCLVLFMLLCSSIAARFDRRDSTPSLETLIIPLALDSDQRYSVAVEMSPGPEQQSFNFVLTTGTGYSVVADASCNNCSGVSGFNASKSTTVKQLSEVQNMTLLGTSASGGLIEENCQLTQLNGSAWPYPNQTLISANSSFSLFSSGISGVFGLGTNGRNGDFSATVFSGWLSRNPGQENFTYGMMLNPPWNSGTNGGVLHWQSPDTASFEGDVVWKPVSDFNSTSFQSDWFITMDSLSFTDGSNVAISQSGELITAVDPFESAMIFPQSIAGAIYGGIAGAALLPSLETGTNKWGIPCNTTNIKLTLTFGSISIQLDDTTLILQDGDLCFGTIEEWSDPQAGEYLLGSSFISLVYLIFSISGSSQGQGVIGFAHRKSHRKLSGGQIAGIVVGSLAFAVLLGIGVFLMYRRYKRREARETPTPDISPPLTPGRPLLIESQGRNTAAFSIASPPFDRDEFGVRPPPSEGQEVMVAFPSSVFTPLRANYTPTESSFTETPPPYHHENPTPHRQVLQSQKSQTTFQSSDIA